MFPRVSIPIPRHKVLFFEKVVVAEPEAAVVDSAGGLHKVETESLEHRKGFQPRGKVLGG